MAEKEPKEELSEGSKETVEKVVTEAREAEKTAHELMFMTKLKKFGMALGGVLLFIGIMMLIFLALLLTKEVGLPFKVSEASKSLIYIWLGVHGSLQILGGLVLIGS